MEFGIFNGMYTPASMVDEHGDAAEHIRLQQELEWVRAADRSGFKYLWATEHHFLEEYSHLSANEAFLGYCAAATERIHIGSGIFNITPPVNHPFRTAEKVAMLDHLSGGRFELGMGRGSSTTEQQGFGIPEPDLTKAMFDEVLPQLVEMWKPGVYPAFDGQFFTTPARNVLPKPLTQPHPPLWVAAGSPPTFAKAAQLGLGVLCFTTGTSDQLAPLIETYKNTIGDADPVGGYVNDNVMVTSSMICLEDGDRARKVMLDARGHYHKSLLFRYLDTFPKPEGTPVWPELCTPYTQAEVEMAVQMGEWAIGDPDEVSRVVQRFEDVGADQMTFGMLSQETPIAIVIEATELFGREVIPRFDKDPEHRTTRLRREQLGANA
ncbi:LLM class flavin-dependent oxidoreductase [Iamia sp. SCSIO 61187]|uniref:LLM class flavin-dependent oxidoreductase n=1 Tax=Iamia sp. SCSIO 61187 TaxID=2722752 RepID=UPI001C6388C8|nr:LLM class flavin-dependent oxidoreductase [Iamia sp. SCSIO 61187]QYG92569.1 LLM class flavin-dependent oxidoreductase [Iamia sp. SCSIO 61187]